MQDLLALYNHPEMDPDGGPQQLQNKVQMDIRYYFCRRGGENVHAFTKETFALKFDVDTKIAYVSKVQDELTKNHREKDNEMITGFMPQLLDTDGRPHRLCPVRSFENYLYHLNPTINNLWQQAFKKKPNNDSWFKAIPLGHNPLDTFMSKLSDLCQLSQHYTNHCIRVTGVSNLLRTGKYTAKQVMAITGHKSIHSLAIYQRVSADEKMMMGMSLTYSLLNPQEVYQLKIAEQLKENQQKQAEIEAAVIHALPPAPMVLQPLPLQNIPPPRNDNQVHALDPQNNNILPLENALVPYNPNEKKENPAHGEEAAPDIDYLEMLCEMENDDENQALTMAVQQIEEQMAANMSSNTTTTSTKALMTKKNLTTGPTFSGCKFGNIGTLNIHIHKH